jgi:hypothetical protein
MKAFLSLCAFTLLPLTLSAQQPTPQPSATPTNANSTQPMFRAALPGGNYIVAVRCIVAVSSHEYIVDGIARVTEVNIDTTGSLLARFYYIEPLQPNAPGGIGAATLEKAQQLLKEAAQRTGQDVWQKVVKNYPTTTHARTVEYRVVNKEDLTKIFDAADDAFRTQRNKSVKIE